MRAREQRQIERLEHVLHPLDLGGAALDDDAPGVAGVGVVAVDLEGHAASEHGSRELGAFGRAEHDVPWSTT